MKIHPILVLSPLLFLFFIGCDGRPTRVPVSGMVLVDGKPLKKDAYIRIVPAEGRPAGGNVNPADGTFALTSYESNDGVMLGTHRVAVICNVPRGEQTVWLIDEKYGDVETSGLTVTIEGPSKDLKIELTGGVKNIVAQPVDEGYE